MRRRNVHCRLYVVDELCPRRVVRQCDQFPKSPIQADEQPIAVVESKSADNCAVWPPRQSLGNLRDEPVETVRTRFTRSIPDKSLEIGVVERLIVVERKAVHHFPQIASE
jgi:hypothetical protein